MGATDVSGLGQTCSVGPWPVNWVAGSSPPPAETEHVRCITGALLSARRETVRLRLVLISAVTFGVVEIVIALLPTYAMVGWLNYDLDELRRGLRSSVDLTSYLPRPVAAAPGPHR